MCKEQQKGLVDVTLLCTMAEAAAKVAEHAALLRLSHTTSEGKEAGTGTTAGSSGAGPDDVFCYRMGETAWFVILAEARQKTGGAGYEGHRSRGGSCVANSGRCSADSFVSMTPTAWLYFEMFCTSSWVQHSKLQQVQENKVTL